MPYDQQQGELEVALVTVVAQTDDDCYNVVEDSAPIEDLQATNLNRLGVDYTKLTFKFEGGILADRRCGKGDAEGSGLAPIFFGTSQSTW